MASKVDLRLEIEALCKSRGVSVPEGLDRMNFAALSAALAGLQSEDGKPSEAAAAPGLSKAEVPVAAAEAAAPEPATATAARAAPEAAPAGADLVDTTPGGGELTQRPLLLEVVSPSPVLVPVPAPPAKTPVVTKTYRIWQVAQGQSVTTVRGQVDGGTGARVGAFGEVKAKDFLRGQVDIDLLVQRGVLVPKS